jgi:hypothetical protein
MNHYLTTAYANKRYYENMKTFKDLQFNLHPSGTGKVARTEFKNGRGISVVQGHIHLGDNNLYEIAELFNNEVITSTVVMELTEHQVTDRMIKIQEQ